MSLFSDKQKAESAEALKNINLTSVISGVTETFGAVSKVGDNINKSTQLDNRGNRTGKVDVAGNTLSMTAAGASLGSVAGPIGTAIGAGAGLVTGLASSLLTKPPTAEEMLTKENEFQLGKHVESIIPESGFAKQQLMAEDGMNVNGEGGRNLEVERDELVLRKVGKRYKIVADFKDGKNHAQGGHKYMAKKGDIVTPGKDRKKIHNWVKQNRFRAIESYKAKLPTDTGQSKMAEGTKGVNTTDPKDFALKLKNSGVKIEKLNPNILSYLSSLPKKIQDKILATSGNDDKHGKNSRHYKNDAVDLRFNQEIWDHIEKDPNRLKHGITLIDKAHGTADHIHLSIGNLTENKKDVWMDPHSKEAKKVVSSLINEGKLEPLSEEESKKAKFSSPVYVKNSSDSINIPEPKNDTNTTVVKYTDDNGEVGYARVSKSGKVFDGERWLGPNDSKEILDWVKNNASNTATEKIESPKEVKGSESIFDRELPKEKNWWEDLVKKDITDPANYQPSEEQLKEFKSREEWEKTRTYWNLGDKKGKKAEAMALGFDPENSTGFGTLGQSVMNLTKVIPRVKNAGSTINSWVTGEPSKKVNIHEIGFDESTPLGKKDKNYIINFLQYLENQNFRPLDAKGNQKNYVKGVNEGNVFMEAFSGVDYLTGKVLAGQNEATYVFSRIGEITNDMTMDEVNSLLSKAEKEGYIDKRTVYSVQDLVTNPEKYWTTSQKLTLGANIATMFVNPKSLAQGVVGLLKGGKNISISAIKGLKSIKRADIAKALKKLPNAAKKVGDSVEKYLQSEYKFKNASEIDEMIKNLDGLGDVKITTSEGNSIKSILSSTKKFVSNLPKNITEKLVGKSLNQIALEREGLSQILNVPVDDMMKMSQADIVKNLAGKRKAAKSALEESIKARKTAYTQYADLNKQAKAAAKKLAELENAVPPKAPKDAAKFESDLKVYRELADEAAEGLKGAVDEIKSLENSSMNLWENVHKIEDWAASPDQVSNWRNLVKAESAIGKTLENIDDTNDLIKSAKKKAKVFTDELRNSSKEYKKTEKIVKQNDGIFEKANEVFEGKETAKILRQQTADKRIELLNNLKSADKELKAAKANSALTETQLREFPKLAEAVFKDENLLKQLKNGKLTAARISNYIRDYGMPDAKEFEIFKEEHGIEEKEQVEAINPKPVEVSDVVNVEDNIKGPDKIDKSPKKAEIDEANWLDSVGDVVSGLTDYAPAVFNIAKGLEPAEKTERHYVNPAMETYENTSQVSLNAINGAFNAASSNARNLSGGLASSYRANLEKAWADKINRTSQVDAQETQNAVGVANRNIQRINQANQINTQVDSKADLVDRQAVSAKENMLGAGISQIAQVGQMRRRDKQMQDNQELMLKFMGK